MRIPRSLCGRTVGILARSAALIEQKFGQKFGVHYHPDPIGSMGSGRVRPLAAQQGTDGDGAGILRGLGLVEDRAGRGSRASMRR